MRGFEEINFKMVKIYLVHGWGGSPHGEGWFGWLMQECEKRNIELIIPEMPNTNNPKINEWVGKMKDIVEVSEETYLVGHSIGGQAIMRFLEGLDDGKIGGVVFVAGWFNLLETAYEDEGEREIAKPWLETPIDCEKVKENVGGVLAIFSTNDDCVPVSDSKLFEERLGAEIIIKENEGHFNETKEIKEIIDFVK